jgi:Na+/H+-dicarboxylate symporter
MDIETNETPAPAIHKQDSFGKEVGKTLIISTVSTAGMVVGVFVGAFLATKLVGSKAASTATETETTPESE